MSYRKKHIQPKLRGLKKRKKFFQNPFFWLLILIVLVGGIGGYFVLFSSHLKVLAVTVSGNEQISQQTFKEFSLAKTNRYFLIDSHKLSSDFLQNYPLIETITIKKDFPDTLAITVAE